jgi:hypothetical protein
MLRAAVAPAARQVGVTNVQAALQLVFDGARHLGVPVALSSVVNLRVSFKATMY